MIIFVAVTYWMILWVTALPGSSSQIKLSYPRIEFIEGLRAVFLFRAQGVSPDAKALVGGLAIGERELLSPEMAENMKTLTDSSGGGIRRKSGHNHGSRIFTYGHLWARKKH